MSFIICSYYTQNTEYEEVARNYLIKSLSAFPNLKSDVRGVENLHSWAKNTSYKAQFIIDMLEQHTENIIFVDCDAEIISYPELFDNIPNKYNFAAHTLDRNKFYGVNFDENHSKELLSGTLFIRNCKENKSIVQEWNTTVKMFPQIWEQQILAKVLEKNNVDIFNLPNSYCRILTLPNGKEPNEKCDNPVIVHHQISRSLRGKVK